MVVSVVVGKFIAGKYTFSAAKVREMILSRILYY